MDDWWLEKDLKLNDSGRIEVPFQHFTEETEKRHEHSHLGKAGLPKFKHATLKFKSGALVLD
jgi:hypothetical protein